MSTLLSTILPQIDTWIKVCHVEWQSNHYFLNDRLMITYLVLFAGLLSRLIVLAGGSTCVANFTVLYLNIHWSGVLTAPAWLVPHETAAVSVCKFCVHDTTMHHVTSCKATYASCNLPPALLAEWPGSFMCYHGNTGVEQIPNYRPWRRKFSHRSSRDLNPQLFNHESGALTTELSLPPIVIVLLYLERVGVWGKGRGRDRGYFSIKTVSMLRSCFAWCLRF